jgi:hypothetical protein
LRQREKKLVACKRLEESKGNKPVILYSFICCFFCCDIIDKKNKEASNKGSEAYIMPDQSRSKDNSINKKNLAPAENSFTVI